MILEFEIRDNLAAFAAGQIGAWDLYDWIDENSIDMHADSTDEAQSLVDSVNHIFAEHDRGVYDGKVLRRKLAALASSIDASLDIDAEDFSVSPQRVRRSSANSVLLTYPSIAVPALV